MVKRENQKKATREKWLAAAAVCFAEKGYSGCSVADIATAAKVSQGSLYVHFKNKEDIFKVMITEEHGQGTQKIRQVDVSSDIPKQIILLLADCVQNVGFPVDHRLWTEILAVAARDKSVQDTFLASDKIMRDALIILLKEAARKGDIDESLNTEALSIWLYALVDGLIARKADNPDFDFNQYQDTFEKLIYRALRP